METKLANILKKMMKTVNLNNLTGIPKHFLNNLNRFDTIFQKAEVLDEVLQDLDILEIMMEIDHYCTNCNVIGFHYTRALPESLLTSGLLSRNGAEIRHSFISQHSHFFNPDEIKLIKREWESYFIERQKEFRDKMIFFNFTTSALKNRGAEPLLNNYGGEQVYMPIEHLEIIGHKIRNIGKPLILKCVLKPADVNMYKEFSWGRIAVSTYHNWKNQDATREDQDGYQTLMVKPENIQVINFQNGKDYTRL